MWIPIIQVCIEAFNFIIDYKDDTIYLFLSGFKLEAASGLILLFAAIIALLVSNSSFSSLYTSIKYLLFLGIKFWNKVKYFALDNDALIAIFFSLLKLKEFIQGELSNPKRHYYQ